MSQIAWAHTLSLRKRLASRDAHCLSLTNTKSVCVQNLGFQHSVKISFPCKALTPRTGKKGQPTLLSRISGHSAVARCPCLWCRTYWFGTCLQLKGKKRSLPLNGELLSLAPFTIFWSLFLGWKNSPALCSITWHNIEIQENHQSPVPHCWFSLPFFQWTGDVHPASRDSHPELHVFIIATTTAVQFLLVGKVTGPLASEVRGSAWCTTE